ncbi:MAG: hypothetical protein SFU27_07750 [Thermonemataceae bacterium]|nr:hypothetical protein [Thermonemataceae bacterium]
MFSKKILLFSAIFLMSLQVAFAQSYTYKGTIGTVKISLNLTTEWKDYMTTYSGSYYYDNVGKELSLRGLWLQRMDTIELVEVSDEAITGFFSLKMDAKAGYDILTGTWTDLKKKKTFSVRLQKQP